MDFYSPTVKLSYSLPKTPQKQLFRPVDSKYHPRAFDILIGDVHDEQDWKLLEPVWEDCILHVPYDWTFAKILCHLGIIRSMRDGKRQGWLRPVSSGFHDLFIGKHRVTILKTEHENDLTQPEVIEGKVHTVSQLREAA